MSRKLRGEQPFYVDETMNLALLLHLKDGEEYFELFFPEDGR